MNNIFKNGSFFLAGALAFTFASCGGDNTNDNQSIVREAEERIEDDELNEPSITYEEGEYQTTEDTELVNYDFDREYAYEDREMVMDRVRDDLERTERSLERLDEKLAADAEQLEQATEEEWMETRRNLEERRQDLSMRMEELETATEQNWEQVRNEVHESLQEFEREWEELENMDIDVEVENETNPSPQYNN